MKVTCDICGKIGYGSIDKLTEEGWNRTIINSPVKKTITRCKEHSDGISAEIELNLLKQKKRRRINNAN